MLSGVRRSPKLLKRMLAQPTSSETPKRSDSAPKRPVQPSENECSSTKRQKTEKDFVDSAIRAVSTDEYLSGVLNLALCQSGGGSAEKQCLVVVTTKTLYYSEPAKHMSHLRLVLSGDGSYYIQVLLQTVEEGNIASPEDFKVLCERVADSRNYKVCPGIEVEEYDQYKQVIGYDPKKVRIVDLPVKRIESTKCERWFPLSQSHGVTRKKRENPHVLCRECVQLQRYLRASVQRLSSVTAEDKVKHEQADSYYPLKYLSPESLQRRKMNVKSALAKKNRIMKRSVPKEIILGDKRRAKISLGESSSCKLESTIGEGEQQGTETRSTLRHVLEQDSTQ